MSRLSMAIVDVLGSPWKPMAIVHLTGRLPDADVRQSACCDGHHQAGSATTEVENDPT
jgi:hypothetical protein